MMIFSFFISIIFSSYVQATIKVGKIEGIDESKNKCFLDVVNLEDQSSDLKDHLLIAKVNYVDIEFKLAHPRESDRVNGKYNPDVYIGNIHANDPKVKTKIKYLLTVNLNKKKNPISYNFFDNADSGLRQRSFNCKFDK